MNLYMNRGKHAETSAFSINFLLDFTMQACSFCLTQLRKTSSNSLVISYSSLEFPNKSFIYNFLVKDVSILNKFSI